jgi:hypothetical protein
MDAPGVQLARVLRSTGEAGDQELDLDQWIEFGAQELIRHHNYSFTTHLRLWAWGCFASPTHFVFFLEEPRNGRGAALLI